MRTYERLLGELVGLRRRHNKSLAKSGDVVLTLLEVIVTVEVGNLSKLVLRRESEVVIEDDFAVNLGKERRSGPYRAASVARRNL